MLWEDKVAEWASNEVTKAMFLEVEADLTELTHQLVHATETDKMLRLQGMCRALIGVMGMLDDGIRNPKEDEDE